MNCYFLFINSYMLQHSSYICLCADDTRYIAGHCLSTYASVTQGNVCWFNSIPLHLTLHCAVYAEKRPSSLCFLTNKFTFLHLIFLIVKCLYKPLVTLQSNNKHGLHYWILWYWHSFRNMSLLQHGGTL